MRRGHPGPSGWRNENPRHFRPRSGGISHYRLPRNYNSVDLPRFPHPGPPRPKGPPPQHPYNTYSDFSDNLNPNDNQNRTNQHRPLHHNQERNIYRYTNQHIRGERNSNHDYSSYFKEPNQALLLSNVNTMGDVDHRQIGHTRDVDHRPQNSQNRDFDYRQMPFNRDVDHRKSRDYRQPPITAWMKPPKDRHNFDNQRSQNHTYKSYDNVEGIQPPLLEYTGHRPPSSDYYGSTPVPSNNNDTSFSRSIDDTVDIVRKRLMNRESQKLPENPTPELNTPEIRTEVNSVQEEPTTKKRVQRQRQNAKSNCDKIKSKIVHQLFKMDKDKIHKLMDNPSSSSKFEFAISSLITESQISFNKHLRSVAEKSLCNPSTDVINNDNNTIYEDTFMKQMQCILDPQDSILLEDIKPIVLAELSKALQLDSFDLNYDHSEDQFPYPPSEPKDYNYGDEMYNENQTILPHAYYDQENYDDRIHYFNAPNQVDNEPIPCEIPEVKDVKPLFQRRPPKIDDPVSEKRRWSREEQKHIRRSLDTKSNEDRSREESFPLFSNTEQLSEEEDPFAELDNQYHVAVDHNFIDNDDMTSPAHTYDQNSVYKDIDNQSNTTPNLKPSNSTTVRVKSEDKLCVNSYPVSTEDHTDKSNSSGNTDTLYQEINDKLLQHISIKQEQTCKEREITKSDLLHVSHNEKPSSHHSRKRSIDQKPSHRKEKRKKSESSPSDIGHTSKKSTDVSNVKSVSKCEGNKPSFNPHSTKDLPHKDTSKDNKKKDTPSKEYSSKYVKRKETPKKNKEKDPPCTSKKRLNSSSHSTTSPKDSKTINKPNITPPICDAKSKLKSFDMFVEQPRKSGNVHQAHRNTAPVVPTTPTTSEPPITALPVHSQSVPPPTSADLNDKNDEDKSKPVKKLLRHVGTQMIKRFVVKNTQTIESHVEAKVCPATTQTDPVSFEKPQRKSADAFERMKEIDMEIQVLLQEKFKLYSSLESKGACTSESILGMAVVNVSGEDQFIASHSQDVASEITLTEDTIVEDFTNIPVEELEQIALETVNEAGESKIKKGRRQKVAAQERKSSQSPTTRNKKKCSKAPNISLIEQIITDDRPLEDIISLDDLETTPIKAKRPQKQPKKKTKKKPKTSEPTIEPLSLTTSDLIECSVVLERIDITNYLRIKSNEMTFENTQNLTENDTADSLGSKEGELIQPEELGLCIEETHSEESVILDPVEEIIGETVENDLHFDMLDVSEDIVIGDVADAKDGDKSRSGRSSDPMSEDIILDNSHISLEDSGTRETNQAGECKMFDYLSDESLKRDSVTVTGNADAVLAIECIDNDFIAACLDGNVYHFSGDGTLLNTLRGSNLAVTCLTIVKEKYGTTVYTGSLDSRIRYYDLETGLEKGPECNVLSPIQTMDRAWDTVFVGTRTGFVLQFECKNNMLIPVSTVKFSEHSILALRAMKEGPRKVLLVAARSDAVTIKDAQSGLLLRALAGPPMTVYTLLLEDGKVYTGTSTHHIHVFDYASGMHVGAHEGGKGAVCLRAAGGLLFAGCYDGCVYVYREGEPRPLAQLRGPGLMLLSLAVVGTKIIAGYKDRSLYIWKIPLSILQEMIL